MDDFRFCSNCGKKVYGTSNFCPKCGHKLKKAIEPPAGLTEDKKINEQVPKQETDKIIYKNNIYKEEKK
jgi:predicted amidophosphoribosyltransferase